eukprot:g82953.t1
MEGADTERTGPKKAVLDASLHARDLASHFKRKLAMKSNILHICANHESSAERSVTCMQQTPSHACPDCGSNNLGACFYRYRPNFDTHNLLLEESIHKGRPCLVCLFRRRRASPRFTVTVPVNVGEWENGTENKSAKKRSTQTPLVVVREYLLQWERKHYVDLGLVAEKEVQKKMTGRGQEKDEYDLDDGFIDDTELITMKESSDNVEDDSDNESSDNVEDDSDNVEFYNALGDEPWKEDLSEHEGLAQPSPKASKQKRKKAVGI